MNHPFIGKAHFLQLSQAGSKLNLSFSGYEVLNNVIMALDGINRKLLLMPCHDQTAEPVIIRLDEVIHTSIKKTYAGIPAGGLKSKSLEAYTDNIVLEFEMANNRASVVITFFDAAINQRSKRANLEKKARNWQELFKKLAGKNNQQHLNKVVLLAKSSNPGNQATPVN